MAKLFATKHPSIWLVSALLFLESLFLNIKVYLTYLCLCLNNLCDYTQKGISDNRATIKVFSVHPVQYAVADPKLNQTRTILLLPKLFQWKKTPSNNLTNIHTDTLSHREVYGIVRCYSKPMLRKSNLQFFCAKKIL